MRDIMADVKRWQAAGKTDFALATIVETRGSSLRGPGTRMVITAEGDVAGSVSSGCVDGDVIAEMEAVLTGKANLLRPNFGISDEQAWGAGLSCGGAIDVLVERWDPLHAQLMAEVEARRPVAFVSRIDAIKPPVHLLHTADGATYGTLGDPDLDGEVLMDIAAAWPGPYAQKHSYPQGEFFIEVIAPPPTLIIFGATDIAVPLAKLARVLDFQVIVSDARRTFLREERFPDVETRFGWPQDAFAPQDFGVSHAVVVLFHDPKFDIPALNLALRSDAFYIGFLGSRKTQADRRASLVEAGFTEQALSRIHGPVGLDIGGKEPCLIALSILAEIVAVRHHRAGGMMSKR
ncbi:MAG TPA: XdhC family protein [Anaerolineae bacterium]|nr:XdhC family protein [Anaerolineae bacterium]HQI83534.1 XdhC family protein [Anaerolineae bacterium]